ncbi:MAG: type II toxin-antitoxin system VapC family toxin [Propionibacteriaceae bacterium]|nr:type II toxin-antitoxin system VapC family toxin [Propionibacteriaceae bacterium]
MIVLDTNVISEAMRGPDADARVQAWLAALPTVPVTTVMNRAEVLAGLALLPPGRRRERLERAATQAFSGLGVVVPFTEEAAAHYGEIVARRTRAGRPIGALDALIAAICLTVGATLATRDTADFAGLGLDLVNPWE